MLGEQKQKILEERLAKLSRLLYEAERTNDRLESILVAAVQEHHFIRDALMGTEIQTTSPEDVLGVTEKLQALAEGKRKETSKDDGHATE